MKTIKQGTSKMKIEGGKLTGWHKFASDAQYSVEYRSNRTVFVVKSGPDKGVYAKSL